MAKLELPVEDIIKLYSQGVSLSKIGGRFNTSSDVIRLRLTGAGIPIRDRHIPKENKPRRRRSLTRFEIFARDGFKCRYCGRSPKEDNVKLIIRNYILDKGRRSSGRIGTWGEGLC